MSDKPVAPEGAKTKKKGGIVKLLMVVVALLALVGGGVGAGLYAASSGLIGGGHGEKAEDENKPKLVPKSEEKRADAAAEGGEGGGGESKSGGEGGGEGEAAGESHEGLPTPKGHGGDEYASNYFTIEKEFTANLKESTHFIQVGIAVSTPYDDRVIGNLKTHEIAVRSAVLMALANTDEEAVFTQQGKETLQRHLVQAINAVLKQKEGFGGISNVYFTNFVVQ